MLTSFPLKAGCVVCLLSLAMVALAPIPVSADPRWCYSDQPGAIFCDDIDRYCVNAPDPNEACSPVPGGDGCTKINGAARSVWVSLTCGYQVNIDESQTCGGVVPVASEPFALGMPNQGDGQLGWNTVGLSTHINDTFGGSDDAVLGTDANPLILDFVMYGQTGGKINYANVYFELSLYDPVTLINDRAPTDFVFSPYCQTLCSPDPGATREIPMICQQDVPPTGCPPIASAPHYKSIAVGTLAYLDKDPCHCSDPSVSSARNEHLAVFDGYKWWTLPGTFTGAGDFRLRDGNHFVRMTITTSMVKVEMTAEDPEPDEYSWCEFPRDYLGSFNRLHMGFGQACLIDQGTWTCAKEPTGDRRYRCIKGNLGAGRPAFDNVAVYGGEGFTLPAPTGACCLPGATCADALTEFECESEQGGVWQGPNTVCLGTVCCPKPYADADVDNDVDAVDFGKFQECFTGSGGALAPGCECFDKGPDGFADGDIDGDDFDAFSNCWTGPTVPFLAVEHPDCPPKLEATTWYYDDFESYADEPAWAAAWPNHFGAGMSFELTGGYYGPQGMGGAKTTSRRAYHSLIPEIQAAGGAGKTSFNGTNDDPLVFEAAMFLASPIDAARTQDFFWDLTTGLDNAPRRVGGIGTPHNTLAFGAFTAYNGLPGTGYREGLMFYDGLNWHHLTTLQHGVGWNFLKVVIRTDSIQFTYFDEALSNGIQHQSMPRTYLGGFDAIGVNSDVCTARVRNSDGYDLSGGVFLP